VRIPGRPSSRQWNVPGWREVTLTILRSVTFPTSFEKIRIDSLSIVGRLGSPQGPRLPVVTHTKRNPTEGEAVMTENDSDDAHVYQQPEPSPDLRSLGNRLVGTWDVSGGARGRATYERMEGGFFLLQRVDLEQF
jgi:hypothetical protein